MVGKTFLMVAQHLKNATISHPISIAGTNHALQFNAEGLEPHQPRLNFAKLPLGDGIDLRTGPVGRVREVQQLSDRLQRKAKLAGMADKGETVQLGIAITPLTAFGPIGLRHQTDLLVIADRLHFGAGAFCECADGKHI